MAIQEFDPNDRSTWLCGRYCPHGGQCTLTEGHEGLHLALKVESNEAWCEPWSDAEAITKTQADAMSSAEGLLAGLVADLALSTYGLERGENGGIRPLER